MIARFYLIGIFMLLCADNASAGKMSDWIHKSRRMNDTIAYAVKPLAAFLEVELKNDTIALIVSDYIKPSLENNHKDKNKILIARKHDNILEFEDLSDLLCLSNEEVEHIIGYIEIGEVSVLISDGLSDDINFILPVTKYFDAIEVYRQDVFIEAIFCLCGDPWYWKFKIEDGDIIPDKLNPYAY